MKKILLILLTIIILTVSIYSFQLKLYANYIPFLNSSLAFFTPYFLIFCIGIMGGVAAVKGFGIKKTLTRVLTILAFLGIPLSIASLNNPVYPEDFENRKNTIPSREYQIAQLDSISNSKITCFFLADCPFCEIAAEHLNVLYKAGKINNIEIVYYAYQETADSIAHSQDLKIPYSNLETRLFFELSGGSYPTIILKEDTQVYIWSGNDVNYACYDYLAKSH